MVKLAVTSVQQKIISSSQTSRHQLTAGCVMVTAAGKERRYRHVLSLIDRAEDSPTHLVALPVGQTSPEAVEGSQGIGLRALRSAVRQAAPLLDRPTEPFSLFVDVSCLSRQQLGEIMAAVKDIAQERTVHLELAYSLGRFVPPPDPRPTSIWRIAPVNAAYSGWTSAPSKPVDVVLGLGYEKGKALGAVEYLEPRSTWIFVPHSPEGRYLSKVREHNKELLRRDPSKQFHYQVLQPVDTYFTLLSLVTGIARDSRPILLPFGPKLYFALTLLVASVVDEASVWFVDGDDPPAPVATVPADDAIVFSCSVQPKGGSLP